MMRQVFLESKIYPSVLIKEDRFDAYASWLNDQETTLLWEADGFLPL